MGSRVERTRDKAVVGGPGRAKWQLVDPERWQLMELAVPHSHADRPGGTTGEEDRPRNPGLQWGEKKPQISDWKHPGDWGSSGRNSQPHRRVRWRDPQGPRTCTSPPTQETAPEGPNLIVGSGGRDWKLTKSGARAIVPSQTAPPHMASNAATWVTTLRPLLHNRHTVTKKKKKRPKWNNTTKLQKKYN